MAIAVGSFALPAHPAVGATASGPSVSVTYSSSDGSDELAKQDDLAFAPISGAGITTIGVDPTTTGQTLDGIGGSLESSSVYNITQLSPGNREAVMRALFDPATGNRYDLMRLSFGCPDFCAEDFYTYDDLPDGEVDPELEGFSIQKDIDAGIIDVAQQALRINPDVEFFASAWSPPAWMKENKSLNNGGSVLPEYYPALADYYRLAIAAYAEQGIPITAVTVANEPLVVPDYPSSSWTWEQERDFIPHLRQALDEVSPETEIWIQDDNWWTTSQFENILKDPVVGPMVDGVGVHDYDDGDVTQATGIVDRYPGVEVRLTERSYYDVKGMDRLVQLFRNDVSSWTYWLTFLDEDGLPNAGPLDGDSFPQQIGAPHGDLDSYYLDRDYYLYAQFSRFLDNGAVRIASDPGSAGTVTNVVFRNPDGEHVAVVVNQTDYDQQFRIATFDGQAVDTLPAATVGTYTWTPEAEALPRDGWTASASLQEWGAASMLDGDAGTAWRNFTAQAAGQSITLDMGGRTAIDQLTLDSGTIEGGASSDDWPRGYEVAVSDDASTWSEPIAKGRGTKRFTNIAFPTVDTRYVRVTLTAAAPAAYWSVAELHAFAGAPVDPSVTVTTDPAAPQGANGWFTDAPVRVSLELQQGSRAGTLEYAVGDAWTPYAGPITVDEDGAHSLRYRVLRDGAEVPAAAGSVRVDIDRVAPVASAALDAPSRAVSISATDAGSGIASVEYRVGDTGPWTPYSAPVPVGAGAATIGYRATDVAGLVSPVARIAVPSASAGVVQVSAVSRCVGTKAYVTVTATNTSTAKSNITLRALSGKQQFWNVAPGRTVFYPVSSTKSSVAAGTASVTAVASAKGSVASTVTAPYAAIACK
ncbi:OmpL47-type beta-barrel domain-containing protein [Clavibacter michiganensis]|uniref:OmpL47-type beta-barrel domain-containing protein n=1 Tax=Clavibacter michiganensis TaxID=28447 RepID=UPI003EB951B3